MTNKKSFPKILLILGGSRIILFGTIGLGALYLVPTFKSLSPMYEAEQQGLVDEYETRYIPAESMLPTFKIDDRILVHKQAYANSAPERGDVILFNPTKTLREQDYNSSFFKRIIG